MQLRHWFQNATRRRDELDQAVGEDALAAEGRAERDERLRERWALRRRSGAEAVPRAEERLDLLGRCGCDAGHGKPPIRSGRSAGPTDGCGQLCWRRNVGWGAKPKPASNSRGATSSSAVVPRPSLTYVPPAMRGAGELAV